MTREEIERLAKIAVRDTLETYGWTWEGTSSSFKGHWMKIVRSIVENMQPESGQESPEPKLEFSFTHASGMHVQVLNDGKIMIDFSKGTDE